LPPDRAAAPAGLSTEEDVMADESNVKTPLAALQDTLSKLKEMEHYSQANIEKLAALWLEVSENKEQKQYEKMVDEVLKCQNQFQTSITTLIEAYEKEPARLKADRA
jgi:hypothetical protein